MPMVDMKRKASSALGMSSHGEGYYPHSLYLCEEDIEKLNLEGATLGTERTLVARVRVTAVSSGEEEGGKKYSSMTLVLVEGDISGGNSLAEKLFGGKK